MLKQRRCLVDHAGTPYMDLHALVLEVSAAFERDCREHGVGVCVCDVLREGLSTTYNTSYFVARLLLCALRMDPFAMGWYDSEPKLFA